MTMKIAWSGVVLGVQSRIRLSRSFDQRQHSYQGYVLRVQGEIGAEARAFVVALGKGAHEKHHFRVGDRVSGVREAVVAPETEIADLYKVAKLEVIERSKESPPGPPPPWGGVAPALEIYRERGHRRLDAGTFQRSCTSCMWGCEMAVEMIIDHWNPGNVRWRRETFCYGPKSCGLYKAGPKRKVPGRKGMSWTEDDWVDLDATSHRGDDD